jgi:hypothetical protein
MTGPAVHHAQDPEPMQDGYKYNAAREGVRDDLVSAVLISWANISPDGDPSGPLRNVGDGFINHVESLARIAALAVVLRLEADGQPNG